MRDEPKSTGPIVDADGTVHVPAFTVPYSPLASEEAKKNFLDFTSGFERLKSANTGNDINMVRKTLDDLLMRPGVELLRSVFPVTLTPASIGGVQTDVILPNGGIAAKNEHRVLINLHGGGFSVAAGYGGQQESIPIASLGEIKVVTVDYREGPENTFPAASEDVATVYRELLKEYQAQNIGIYGCSAGGILTAQSVAWFQVHGLPRPGAVGMFGAGAVFSPTTDSSTMAAFLSGWQPMVLTAKTLPYFDIPGFDPKDPLVSPVHSRSVLEKFPPSLLISGTRDASLSSVVYTHAELIKAGVEAALHIWEGAPHCSYAQPVVDPAVPETREAWDVIVKFFDKHLGRA